ncbi:hypothetical protein M758_7G106300 [Ceratodon purpureus]|nr:hypothetical protein M758_7G106300 [Ceratodon purpureus]
MRCSTVHYNCSILFSRSPQKTVISQFFQEPLSNHLVATKFLNIKTTNSTQSEMPHGTQLTYTQLHKQHSTLNMEQLDFQPIPQYNPSTKPHTKNQTLSNHYKVPKHRSNGSNSQETHP